MGGGGGRLGSRFGFPYISKFWVFAFLGLFCFGSGVKLWDPIRCVFGVRGVVLRWMPHRGFWDEYELVVLSDMLFRDSLLARVTASRVIEVMEPSADRSSSM